MFAIPGQSPINDWTQRCINDVLRRTYKPNRYNPPADCHERLPDILDAMPPIFGELLVRYYKYGQPIKVLCIEMALSNNEIDRLLQHGRLCLRNAMAYPVRIGPEVPPTDELFDLPLSIANVLQFARLGYGSIHELEDASDDDLMIGAGIGMGRINNLRQAIIAYRAGVRMQHTSRLIPKARKLAGEIKNLQDHVRGELKHNTDHHLYAALSSLQVMLQHAEDVTANIMEAARQTSTADKTKC